MEHPLRRYRRKVGITLETLAVRVGATKATLSRIECGSRFPSIALVGRLVAESEGLLRADDFLPAPHPVHMQSTHVNGNY
jgi:transcriptional regulator with XRE-family HTH domain